MSTPAPYPPSGGTTTETRPISSGLTLSAADFDTADALVLVANTVENNIEIEVPTPASIGRAVSVRVVVIDATEGFEVSFSGLGGATLAGDSFSVLPALTAAGQAQAFQCDPNIHTTRWF